jgi:5-oxoprolinase (ATP-hydrolysing) subunit A
MRFSSGPPPSLRDRGVTRDVIDLNADVGESFGAYTIGHDEELIPYVSSVSVAGGLHAGDPGVIARTVAHAEEFRVAVGAHPGYPDLAGFGRREMSLSPAELRSAVRYQVGAVAAFTSGRRLQHVKPHGAMYNRAARDEAQARVIVEELLDYDERLIHVVLAGSVWERIAREAGARVAGEAFADRAVLPDGSLVPRSEPGAVIHQPDLVAERAVRIAREGMVRALDGSDISIAADTLCIHGDTTGAPALAALVRRELERGGIDVRAMGEFIP